MARFISRKPPDPIRIDKWLGVNESIGQTGIALGEALRQVNYRITKDYKPQKRSGHKTFIDYENEKDVQGMWIGSIGNKNVLISCNDGKVYEYDFDTEINTQIGTLTDAKTSILFFESKLYFWDGTGFKEYNGTTFQDVVPYEPTKYIALAPDLTGFDNDNIYEQENLLTGRKWLEYQGNGTATEYKIPELPNLDSELLLCTVDGVTKTEITDFTVDRTVPKMTFSVAPANGSLIRVRVRKDTVGNADLIKKNRFAMTFGPGNDTSIFIWGNPAQKNRRSWCASLNPAYWPITNFTNIGTNEFAITDIKAQNANYQVVFKEDRTHYSYAEYISATKTFDYPVFDLNERVGNITFNGVQIVNNNPVSIKGGAWWYWSTTSVEDERNADVISQRLEQSLSAIDLTKAVTFDYQSKKEYWCNVDDIVYIWNYGNNTMYTFDNISGTCFIDLDGVIYYGSQGTIERVEGLDDNGEAIVAQLDTGYNSYGSIHLIKTSDTVYVGLLPDSQTSCTVYFKTNKINEFKKLNRVAEYRLLDWNNIDFNHYTFLTNRNPQTISLKLNSREYTYIQFRFENAELNETCTLLEFLVQAESQGEV